MVEIGNYIESFDPEREEQPRGMGLERRPAGNRWGMARPKKGHEH